MFVDLFFQEFLRFMQYLGFVFLGSLTVFSFYRVSQVSIVLQTELMILMYSINGSE